MRGTLLDGYTHATGSGLRADGLTQAKIGQRIGWSNDYVSKHLMVADQISTQALSLAKEHQAGRVDKKSTSVEFTEGWFRGRAGRSFYVVDNTHLQVSDFSGGFDFCGPPWPTSLAPLFILSRIFSGFSPRFGEVTPRARGGDESLDRPQVVDEPPKVEVAPQPVGLPAKVEVATQPVFQPAPRQNTNKSYQAKTTASKINRGTLNKPPVSNETPQHHDGCKPK